MESSKGCKRFVFHKNHNSLHTITKRKRKEKKKREDKKDIEGPRLFLDQKLLNGGLEGQDLGLELRSLVGGHRARDNGPGDSASTAEGLL